MRYTTATAFAAMMGMTVVHAAPVVPNITPDENSGLLASRQDHLGMPTLYEPQGILRKLSSRRNPESEPTFRIALPGPNPNLPDQHQGRFGKKVASGGVRKREASPQRGRRIGNAFEGVGDAIGFLGDALTIHDAVNQKREESFQRTHPGNAYENIPNLAEVDHDSIASLQNNAIEEKREASPDSGHGLNNPISAHLATNLITEDMITENAGKTVNGKREADPQRNSLPNRVLVSKCPGYYCGSTPPAIQEMGAQVRWETCCL
ncbi:hypothetical protein PTMSG1_03706 [Pyrenophora teres f. maculata]|nr:hypothetical protein PTMSG1_03706 [Pyrenophora teres f. maculata]